MKDLDFKEILRKFGIVKYIEVGTALNENLEKMGVVDLDNALYFISNCIYESNEFKTLKESLYYTTPERLKLIFPSAFKERFNPNDYIKNTEKLANLVYSDVYFPQKKLGNTKQGYGFKYIGRGAIQITGYNNYKAITIESGIDFVNNPELLETPFYSIIGSLAYWKMNNINKVTSLRTARSKVLGVSSGLAFNESLIKVEKIYKKLKTIIEK